MKMISTAVDIEMSLSTGVRRGYLSVFGSVVAGAFQITFRAKMHANDVFSFF